MRRSAFSKWKKLYITRFSESEAKEFVTIKEVVDKIRTKDPVFC